MKYITISKCKPWTWVMVPIKTYSINNIKDMRRHENHLIQQYKPQLNFIGTYKQNNKRDVYKKLRNKRLRNKIKNFNESATTFKYKQHGNCQTVKKDMDIRRYQPHFLQLCHFVNDEFLPDGFHNWSFPQLLVFSVGIENWIRRKKKDVKACRQI